MFLVFWRADMILIDIVSGSIQLESLPHHIDYLIIHDYPPESLVQYWICQFWGSII